MKIILSVLIVLILASQARSESAIQCHCFQERSFDAANPAKVDRYLLATSQNSLLAVLFGTEKAQIVRKRMAGTSAQDLWIGYYMAAQTPAKGDDLLNTRKREGTWKTALLKSGIKPTDFSGPIAAAFKGGSDLALADAVADESVARALGAKRSALAELRAQGAGTAEIAIATLLAKRYGRPPQALWSEIRGGKSSWGLLTATLGIDIGNMEKEFAAVMER